MIAKAFVNTMNLSLFCMRGNDKKAGVTFEILQLMSKALSAAVPQRKLYVIQRMPRYHTIKKLKELKFISDEYKWI